MSVTQMGVLLTLEGASQVETDLRRVSSSFSQTGVSAAQTAAAMRQVPMQMTDIVTSLQAGQAPLTVLLQQGGQLKDSFGGIGNAIKGVSGYLADSVKQLGVAGLGLGAVGVGVAAVATAMIQGSKEAEAYSKALILSGNATGVTVGQLQAQAKAISAVSGATQSAAAEAIAQVAASGKIGADNLGVVTEAALRLERVGVQSVSKTVEQFTELGKSPVEASIKLNEQYNYLTTAVFKQIKALEDEGRASEAAELAQRTLAESMSTRSVLMAQKLGLLERAWEGVKDVAKEAWDGMLGLGRESTVETKIDDLQRQIADRQARNSSLGIKDGAATRELQLQLTVLQATKFANDENARSIAEGVANRALSIRWLQEEDKYLSKSSQMEREIKKARAEGQDLIRAGLIEEKDLRERIAGIQAKYADKSGAKSSANPFAADQEAAKEWAKYVQEFSKAAADAEAKTDGLTKSQSKLVEFLQSPGYANMPESARQLALEKAYAAIAAEKQGEAEKVLAAQAKEAAKAYDDTYESIVKRTDAIAGEAAKQREANEAIGLSASAIAALEAARLEEQAVAKLSRARLADEIDWSGKLGDAYREQAAALRDLAKVKVDGAAAKGVADAAKAAADEWKRTSESIERSITDSLMRGFESGKGFARNMRDTLVNLFKTLVLRPVISFIVNPIAGAINAALGGSSIASSVGAGASLVSGGMSVSNYVGTGIANATGTGIDGLLASNGAFGTAGGMGSVVSTAIPYIAAAFAAYGLLSSLNGGETRTGGQYAVAYDGQVTNNRRGETYQYVGQQFNRDNSNGVRVTNGQAYLIEADGMGAQDKAVRDAVSSTANSIQETLKALGSKLTLTGFWAGMETSSKDRGGVFSGLSLSNGKQVGESGKGDNYSGTLYELTSTRSPDAATALANFTLDLKQVTIEALQAASDIPKTISDKLQGVDAEALTSDAADTLLKWISDQINNVNALATIANSLPLKNLQGLSFDAAAGLIELSGGLDTLASQAQSYYQNFYSASEQTDNTLGNIKTSLKSVGLELPTTRDGFRKLVEAQDLNTESGRKAYAALMAVSGAFASVTPAAEGAAKRTASDISSERTNLQDQLDQLTMSNTDLLKKQREALDESNRAIFDQIQAEKKAQSVKAERTGLQDQLDQLTLTNAQLLEKQRAALDESNRAIFDQIQAEKQAASIKAERTSLQDQLDQLTLTNAELLAKQRAALDESNRALFDQIQAEKQAASIKAERTGLQDQLDQLTLSNTQLLEKQRAALDESNRAIFDQIQAEKKAASIKAERTTLQDQLDQLTLTNAELLAKQRAALDESNRAIFDQIQAEKKAAEVKSQRATLQDEYDQLTMTSAQLLDKQRNALDESNRALFDKIQLEKKAAAVASERASLQTQLDQALGNTAALRAAELAKLDESNRALQERIWAIADARAAADAAYSALEASINKQRTALQQTASIAQEAVSTIGSIYETLKSNVADLYNSVSSTQGQGKAQALAFIDQALAGARATGSLPEGQALTDAIAAARNGLSDSNTFASAFEQQRAQLILAGKLAEMQTIAGVQKTIAQQQLDAANDQLSKLDDTLAYWKQQLDISNGTYKATVSVADAIKDLSAAILKVNAATGTGTASAGSGGAGSTSGGTSGSAGGGFSVGPGSGSAPAPLTGEEGALASIHKYFLDTYDLNNRAGSLATIAQTAKEYGVTQGRMAKAIGWSEDELQRWFAGYGIPAFAVGTNYVPSDMLAMIHQGEAIVPKAYNPAANGVLQSDGQVAQLLTALVARAEAAEAQLAALGGQLAVLNNYAKRTADATNGNAEGGPLRVRVVGGA